MSQRSYLQWALIALVLVMSFGAIAKDWRLTGADDTGFGGDFAPFYCSGATRIAHGNPYLAADIASCGERRGARPRYVPPTPRLEDAPQPGYDIALFSVFAHAPYRTAALAWTVLSLLAMLISVPMLARLCRTTPLVAFASLAVLGTFYNLEWGQLPPIAVAAIIAAAWCVSTGRFVAAGIAVCVSLIEPHLGGPALIALLVWVPRARVSAIVSAAVLAAISLAYLGVHENIEYFTRVLPMQSDAEAPNAIQYSLTYLLHELGVPTRAGEMLASLQYVIVVALGIAAARRVADAVDEDGALILIPPALAVIGGPFIHVVQMLAAVPALLLLANRSRTAQPALWAAVILAGATWKWEVTRPFFIVPLIATIVIAYAATAARPLRARIIACAAAAIALFVVNFALNHVPQHPTRGSESLASYTQRVGTASIYAPVIDGTLTRTAPGLSESSPQTIARKLPTWIGLLILLFYTFRLALRPEPAGSPRSRELIAA